MRRSPVDTEPMAASDRNPRWSWRLLAVVAVLGVVAGLLLLPGDDGDELPALTRVAQAAERTAEYPGARMRVTGQLDLPGTGTAFTMHGSGSFNGETGRSRLTMAADLPPEAAAQLPGGQLEIEQVGEQRPGTLVMYMRSEAFGSLPDGAEWMKLDFSDLAGAQGQSMDPREQLKVLQSSDDFRKLGTERIRGIRTTHYGATIDQAEEVERLRDEGEDTAAEMIETVIEANDGESTSEVEVWIGPGPKVHRFRMEIPFSVGASPGSTMVTTTDLFDFGVTPDIALPDESDVYDATDLAREELERLSD
jgi:hypothetical protein